MPSNTQADTFDFIHEHENAIAKIQIFSGLRTKGLRKIAQLITEETYPANTLIFKHGELGDKLYLVLEGRIRIVRSLQGMGEETLSIISPGEVFGEMALFDDAPRSADAKVHERCRLFTIRRNDFEELMFMHKDIAYEVLWSMIRLLSDRLRESNDRLSMLSSAANFR